MNEERAAREIELTARLLNAEKSGRRVNFEESVNALYEAIRTDFRPALEQSSVRDKDRIYADIIGSVDGMGIFCSFPELLGKSFAGVFGLDRDLAAKFLASAAGKKPAEYASADSNIPAVFIDGRPGITAVNDAGSTPELSGLEYSDANRSLWRRNIDIRAFLRFYLITDGMKYKNTAFVYFPEHVNADDETGRMLIGKLDSVIVCTAEDYRNHKNNALVRELRKTEAAGNIPFELITSEKDIKGYDAGKLDIIRRNSLFTDRIRSTLLEVRAFYEREIRQLQEDKAKTASDLVNITSDENTRRALAELSSNARDRLDEAEQEKRKFDSASIMLMDKAKAFEADMDAKISGIARLCETAKEIWQKIFLQAIEAKDFQLASEYLGKFQSSGETFSYYIYAMLLKSARGERPGSQDLEKLRYSPDSELVLKTKLLLRKELNYSDENCMGIAFVMKHPDSPEELYYRGMYEEVHGSRKQAEINYRRSLSMGYAPAGAKLFGLAGNDRKTLQILADQMIPEANFALGEIARDQGKYISANRYFKLAAAKEYMPAVKILADEAFGLFMKDRSRDSRKAERSIKLYSYILSREHNNITIKERLGDICRILNDSRRAFDWWQQCGTGTAYYKMGKMYMYHDGAFGQDLDTAENYLKKALNLGYARASEELKLIQLWKQNDAQKRAAEQARKRESYSSRTESHSYSSSSSSGCFVITAANSALHVLDRWAFRRLLAWRNRLRRESPLIAVLIEEYYRAAPAVVSRIEADTRPAEIYGELWEKFIAGVYELVCKGMNYEAAKVYADMMKGLCERYGVDIQEETRRNLEMM